MKFLRIGLGLVFVLWTAAQEPAAQLARLDWTAEGNQAGAGFGSGVSTAGDVNGDGFDDVIVGCYACANGQFREGRAFVYYGSPAGLSKLPDWSAESNQPYAVFGSSTGAAGDVNGDGYDDVLVSAPNYDNGLGRAYLYLGSPAGLSATPAWIAEPGQRGFASTATTAGDVNGDGFSDVVVGVSGYENGQENEGAIYLYLGSALGLAANPALIVEGSQANSGFGAVASAGDVNGDGFDDVIAGAWEFNHPERNEGKAFLYLGSPLGLSTPAAWTAESNQVNAGFGSPVSGAGDVNGDGYDDVLVGALSWESDVVAEDEGAAFLYLGSATGLALTPAWTAEGNQRAAVFGWVSDAGDVNDDGYDDVLVGAPGYDHGRPNEGIANLYLGSSAGLSLHPIWSGESNQRDANFGYPLARAGDVNGDGYDDLIISAILFSNGQNREGRAFTYLGSDQRRLR